MRDLEGLADVVIGVVSRAMAPMAERLAVAESKLAQYAAADQTIAELRERVVVAETKATLMRPDSAGEDFLIRLAAVESKLAAQRDFAPIEHRLEALEGKPEPAPVVSAEDVSTLRDRLVAVETKAAGFETRMAAPDPLGALVEKAERTVADLSKDLGGLRERVAVVEVRQPVPGPAGKDGANGKDGMDGVGFDDIGFETDDRGRVWIKASRGDNVKRARLTGCTPRPFLDGTEYLLGDKSIRDGGEWTAMKDAPSGRPGEGSPDATGWLLTTKRGKDGRDLRDAKDVPPLPVVTVGGPRG